MKIKLTFQLIIIFFITSLAFSINDQEYNVPQKAEAYYRYALAHLFEINDELEEALKNYKLALEADPDSASIKINIASIYLDEGKDKEAINLLEEIIQKDFNNQEALDELGKIYFNYASYKKDKKDIEKAINYFEKLKKINPQYPSTFIHLGKLYSMQGNYNVAIEQYLEYINLRPYSLIGYLLLESLYEEQGKYKEAIEVLENLEKKDMLNEKAVLKLLELYNRFKDVNKIEALFEKIKKRNNYSLWKEFAKAFQELKQPEKAQKLYEVLYLNDPKDSSLVSEYAELIEMNQGPSASINFIEAHIKDYGADLNLEYKLALLYERIRKWDKAENIILSIISSIEKDMQMQQSQKEQNLKMLYFQMGFILQQKHNYDEAIGYLKKAKDFSDTYDYKIDVLIAYNLFKEKEYDKAIEVINNALNKAQDKTDLNILLAQIKEASGKADEAIALLKKLIKEDRDNKEYLFALVETYERQKKFNDAEVFLLDYIKKGKITDSIAFTLGVIYEKQKKYDEAEKYLRKAIELNPDFAEALNYLGYMLIDLGLKIEESIEYIKRALNIDKDNGAYLDSLGWGYYRLNKLDLALENLKKAIEILPDNPVICDHLGDVYYKLGNYKEAIFQWQRALKNKNDEIDEAKIELKIKGASSLIK